MNELVFPVLGAMVVVLLVSPLAAALGLLLSSALDCLCGSRLVRWGGVRHAVIVGSCALPLVWAVSAGIHQAEPGRAVLACLLGHELEQLCLEPLLFVSLLLAFAGWRSLPLLLPLRAAARGRSRPAPAEAERVTRLIAETPLLRGLEGRLVVTQRAIGGSAALGVLRPVVTLDAAFVRACDDEALTAALAHELEHVRGLDPLRYLLLAASLRLVPFGEALLGRCAANWRFAREVECDRAAVLAGAPPLGLAQALLQASRPVSPAFAHLGGAASRLRLRVELLLAYAEQRPLDDVSRGPAALVSMLLLTVGVVLLPHSVGASALDFLHTALERVVAPALR